MGSLRAARRSGAFWLIALGCSACCRRDGAKGTAGGGLGAVLQTQRLHSLAAKDVAALACNRGYDRDRARAARALIGANGGGTILAPRLV